MKQFILIMLSITLVFSLVACRDDASQKTESATDVALLDEIVGEWGFVAPRWAGMVPAGFTKTEDPFIRFYVFTENGTVRENITYIEYGKIRPLSYDGRFTIDEKNNTIYLAFEDKSSSTELRYVFEDGKLQMFGGFYATLGYEEDYKTEIFKANWYDLWEGIGLEDTDFIQAVADNNPAYVPDFFKQSENVTDNAELSDALVGQWGTVTPTWYEEVGLYGGTYKRRPSLFCYNFTEDGKVILTYTAADEDGIQKVDGVYYWNEENNTITLSFNADDTDFSYSFDDGTFKLYGSFFSKLFFTQEGLIEFFKADWTDVCADIADMGRNKRDDYLKAYLSEHPEYKSDFFSNN